MSQAYAVYWRSASRQLFSFRQSVQAASPQEARRVVRGVLQRQRAVIVGVKRLAACGRRCTQKGRWVG